MAHIHAPCEVFSNEVGESLKTFKKAWVVAVLKAQDVDPHRRKGRYKDVTTDSQKRSREVNLHWHDLRHEYASRLAERGVPLAQVRDLLGHASILTTERYDNQRLEALQAAAARLEAGKAFDTLTQGEAESSAVAIVPEAAKAACAAEALSKGTARRGEISTFFQVPAEDTSAHSGTLAARTFRSN